MRTEFQLQKDVHENVVELRRYLGSATTPLSLLGLAGILNKRDGRARSASTIVRWENGAEPDYGSAEYMAELAGVTFAEFCLGRRKQVRIASVPVVDRAADEVPAPSARLARTSGGRRRGS